MAKLELTTESIKDLMLSFSRCGLTGMELEDEGFRLSFSKEQGFLGQTLCICTEFKRISL